MILALFLTLSAGTCETFAEKIVNLNNVSLANLSLYYSLCTEALAVDREQVVQKVHCILYENDEVTCDFYSYGDRRYPFEPRYAQ